MTALVRMKVDLIWFVRARPEILWSLVAVLLAVGLHAWLIARLMKRLGAVTHVTHRVERLTTAVSLLTDTLEAGLSTVASEVHHMSRKPAARPASRAATGRRIAAAAKRGDDITAIASHEAISESEVRLHLALTSTPKAAGGSDDVRA